MTDNVTRALHAQQMIRTLKDMDVNRKGLSNTQKAQLSELKSEFNNLMATMTDDEMDRYAARRTK